MSADPKEPADELAPGTRLLERFTILDRVGSGGMASIWRAKDERLDRVVSVKLLRLVVEGSYGATGDEIYEATYTHFLQEAAALSKLQHPNTLRIYDFGYLDDGRPFQIAEFLEGGNLETQVRAVGRFGEVETLGVLERICGAVAEAHEHGILHRDIKPSNILFARVARESDRASGHVLLPKLADFGIASSRVHRAGDAKNVSSVCLFSPRWAAPEQLCSEAEGPTTDVYALGLVTAFMLGGRAPFADKDVRAHFDERILGDEFAMARLTALGLKGDVLAMIARAMTADPRARTPSPLAFFDDARAVLAPASGAALPLTRRPLESITLVIDESSARHARAGHDAIAPPERIAMVGSRAVRVVEVNEKLDLSVPLEGADGTGSGTEGLLRFRVTLLPAAPAAPDGFAIHLKGLSCFVELPGARPTPAITATSDGEATFIAGDRTKVGTIRWSFGRPSDAIGAGAGRAFDVTSGETLVIPYEEASQAIAIDLGPDRELIVMGRRRI